MSIKQLVPASSRSFWQLYDEVESLKDKVQALSEQLDLYDSQTKLMLWEAMRSEGQSLEDAKKEFFLNIPSAEGDLRLVQLATTQLLHEFDELCSKYNLKYWIACGTALGALRHQGFVPWDDDVDLGMPRADIQQLQQIVAEKESRFCVTVVFDRYSNCRQVRFRYADLDAPCFLDLFIFDYVLDSSHKTFERMQIDRKALLDTIETSPNLAFWNSNCMCLDSSDVGGAEVAAVFDAAVSAEYEQGDFITSSLEDAAGIMWGVDNLDSWDNLDWIQPIDDVFPLQRVAFEGIQVNAVADLEKLMHMHFGDYYSFPKKMHFSHIETGSLTNLGPEKAFQ